VIGAVICLQLTAENYSRPAAPMLASSRYSPAVPIKLAKHACQLNLFAIPTKEISGAKHVQPCFIEPMQVSAVPELPDGGFWTSEAKLDGYRSLAAKRGTNVVLWSRRGTGFTPRFPSIARACEKLQPRHAGHIQFYAFDILVHRGRNVLRLRLRNVVSC